MADAIFLFLLVVHIGSVVGWMGGAALFTSVIIPSLSKMSPQARIEFIRSAFPRYIRFTAGSAILAIVAGLSLYAYITQVVTSLAPSPAGTPYVSAGAVLGLIVLIIALGIMVPSGRKFVALTKEPPSPQTQPRIASLQKRMNIAGRAGLSLLGIALILMVIGASL